LFTQKKGALNYKLYGEGMLYYFMTVGFLIREKEICMLFKCKKISSEKLILNVLLGCLLAGVASSAYCSDLPIIISGNQVINNSRTYSNKTLDLSHGEFTVNTGASLTIENSIVNVTISPDNPFFIKSNNGDVILHNDIVNVTVSGITQTPDSRALYNLLQVLSGNLQMTGNNVVVNTPFTVGVLATGITLVSGFDIGGNTFKNFHGGLYLRYSSNARIYDNTFQNVSYANIYNSGARTTIERNIFSFPGNLKNGDAIDLVNSNDIDIKDNIIETGGNFGIYVMGSQNLTIDNNRITDGQSYGIFIQTALQSTVNKKKYLSQLTAGRKLSATNNDNITITNNYIAQNRYGLAGEVVNNLIVKNNTFVQKFDDNSSRLYWTNNDNLLPSVSNLTWENNFYKEAFTQEVPGDNTLAHQFVTFPAHGGVSLS
jgi:parallel beta-helix repeat protein